MRLLGEQSGESVSNGGISSHKTLGGQGIYQGGDERGYFHYGDKGTAARYFKQFPGEARFRYQPKASRKERTANGQVENTHPTVKSLELMRYLCRLTKTPKGGIVLDPFVGSGTALLAARLEGRQAIGIEMEQEYCDIAVGRLEAQEPIQKKLEAL